MSKVIAVFNQSGGVSKTTLTMNLGYHLAQSQQSVLLVDMDPQASLTTFMGLEPSELGKTVYEAILGEEPLPIHQNIHGIDMAPANINLSGAELELVVADMRDIRLKEALEPVIAQYQFILIDCPPSLGILSYISLVAATHVLIPIQTEYKALKGTELLDLSENLKCLIYNGYSDFNGLRSQALGGRNNKTLGGLIELIYQLARKR